MFQRAKKWQSTVIKVRKHFWEIWVWDLVLGFCSGVMILKRQQSNMTAKDQEHIHRSQDFPKT